MPRRVAEVREGALGLALHRIRVRQEYQRVKIALQGDSPAHARARRAEAHGPVDPDCIAAARRNLLEPGATALGEHDAWHSLTACLARERSDHTPDVRQREFDVRGVR